MAVGGAGQCGSGWGWIRYCVCVVEWVGLDRVLCGGSGWSCTGFSLVAVGGSEQGIVWWKWVGLDRGQVVAMDGLGWFHSNG